MKTQPIPTPTQRPPRLRARGLLLPALAAASLLLAGFVSESQAGNTLQSGQSLYLNNSIISNNGAYGLYFQSDGSLVLYDFTCGVGWGVTLWNSKTAGQGGTRCTMQADGNLVIYRANNTAVWATGTNSSYAKLQVLDSGNLVIKATDGTIVWQTGTVRAAGNDMKPGNWLKPGDEIRSSNGVYKLVYQTDNNLVIYEVASGAAVWCPYTNGIPALVQMQHDGNLVITKREGSTGTAVWASGTGDWNNKAVLDKDGSLVIYHRDGWAVWATPQPAELLTDRHLIRGVTVLDPTSGDIQGSVQVTADYGAPIWKLAQWLSHGTIWRAGYQNNPDGGGGTRWSNQYKAVTLTTGSCGNSDFILSVNSINEYGNVYRDGTVKDWPHLLVQRPIEYGPTLDQISNLNWSITALLKNAYSRKDTGAGYDPNKHGAQFVIYYQIVNKNIPGKYLWFGIKIYDDRYAVPGLYANLDAATGSYTYNVGLAPFSSTGMSVGQWRYFAGDIKPLIIAGLNKAWSVGYLNESHNLADYKIGPTNMGWEVSGLSNVTMQIKDVSLRAVGPGFGTW
jgi:hypothetical protein